MIWILAALTMQNLSEPAASQREQFCSSYIFRETPHADIRCAQELDPAVVGDQRYFHFRYDEIGRLIEVSYVQSGALREHSDRFLRASRTVITYEQDEEIRRYFGAFGHRILVSGDVYESRFTLNADGSRRSLRFIGLDGEMVENDFGIARYQWTNDQQGNLIEWRYDLDGNIVRNRPGFGYLVTRFVYDDLGLLVEMTNLGVDGAGEMPDEAGIVSTRISYDEHGRFVQWLNLNADGEPQRGMSNIAEIRYVPSDFASEAVATFVDADGSPQSTNWGIHQVRYQFDRFGNVIAREHFGEDGMPANAENGIGYIEYIWSDDGARLLTERYYDADRQPVSARSTGIHAIIHDWDSNVRSTRFLDLDGNQVEHPGLGYGVEIQRRNSQGQLSERQFEALSGQLADHAIWRVARSEWSYTADGELERVQHFSADGEERPVSWNPAH